MQFSSLVLLALPLLALAAPVADLEPTKTLAVRAGSTENGLTTDTCKPLIIIFARGTNEAGNVGTIAGPPMFAAVRSALGEDQVLVQGVPYVADYAG